MRNKLIVSFISLLISTALIAAEQTGISTPEPQRLDPGKLIPGARSLILPASSFVGEGARYASDKVWGKSGTAYRLRAPVYLPDGALIRVFSVRFVNRTTDMGSVEPVHLRAILERAEFVDPSPTTQISQATVDTPKGIKRFYGVRSVSSIKEPRVDTSRFLYQVLVYPRSPGNWMREGPVAVSAVKIVYTIP